MAEVVFSPRYGELLPPMTGFDLELLGRIILRPDGPGWQFSEGIIEYRDAAWRTRLMVLRELSLGYYLQYVGPGGVADPDDIWLSLGDQGRLAEVVCPDDCEASAGLFIPTALAWEAIRHFCESGMRCPAVEWISHRDVPAEGNW